MKKLAILGSTGSIGQQTLEVVRKHPDQFRIVGLTAHSNVDLLKKQVKEFQPEIVSVFSDEDADAIAEKGSFLVHSGKKGIEKVAAHKRADTVVNALVGASGVEPTMAALKEKKHVALANKETLVVAGSVVMKEAAKQKVTMMPIDSEHSALFQCLNGEKLENVSKITITASGGPFRKYSRAQLQKVTAADALKHPTWKMGNKITIDSATLMNKGFEVMEAHWLYGLSYDQIEVVVHPQSIVHSLVTFKDGSTMAQLGNPDMRVPIQYALSYPDRLDLETEQLDLAAAKQLDFEQPDFKKFPCLQYVFDVGKEGGTLPAVLNAANEVAVHAFLNDKISYLDIASTIKKMLNAHKNKKNPSLKDILDTDHKTREETKKLIT